MKGYKAVGYSVVDKFGERLCHCPTRQACEDLIEKAGWEGAIIVKRLQSLPKPVKPKVEIITATIERKRKKIIQAKHIRGTVLNFQSTKFAAQFFECTTFAVNTAIAKYRYMTGGAMKDWKITREEVYV